MKLKVIMRGSAVNILYSNGKQQPIPLGVSINPKHFTGEADKWISKKCPNYVDLNATISERLSEVRTFVVRHNQDHKKYPSPKSMQGFFKRGKKTGNTFEQLWNQYIQYQTHKGDESVSLGRVEHYRTSLKYILQFRPQIQINDIDVTFCDEFKHWLKTDKGNGANRINTYISILKAFLYWAISKEKTTLNEKTIKQFKTSWTKRDIIFNPKDELQMLLDVELGEFSYLDKMRDAYLLQCFIGVRHSDLKPDKWQIQNNTLRKITEKTEEEFSIPLRSEARFLIEKYTTKGISFPDYENQPYNRAIKEIAKLAGITQAVVMVKGRKKFKPGERVFKYQLMSSHTARATFICNMIEANVQSWKIMKMTGIKKEATLKHYAEVMEASLQTDMDFVEQKQGLRITHIRRAV